ncbi:sigma-70 family RNA polymerase sigma factor [uncultured Sphingosinicella sp.]|uniref:RNA polymerase sigma factor n=1 Tax=uncultured Sphingosinicella sp. TaxID=478748 RepID=UPI0030DB4D2E|tara:strand:+ start:2506 stop:3069 length:564 start_codon:yes stop_codon:yes gene_type:complete
MQLNLWSSADPADDEFHARVAEAKAPDVAALYREEAPRLRRLFGRRTRQADAVQDLVQSVFARFLGRSAGNHVLDEPRAYLTRIACNLLRDTARQQARRGDRSSVSIEEIPGTENALARLEARDMLRRIDAAILVLPARTREIFMAHRFEELTYPEIAARMGVCVKTVEKHISLALRALHRELGQAE